MKKLYALLLVFIIAVMPGCGTLIAERLGSPSIYSGTKLDCVVATLPFTRPTELRNDLDVIPFIFLAWLDLPFSFTYDTLLLPWKLIR